MEAIDTYKTSLRSKEICVFYLRAIKLIARGVRLEDLSEDERNCLNCPHQGYCGINNLEDQFMFRNYPDTKAIEITTLSGNNTG